MELAKRFGALLASAVAPVPDIELRLIGFTDRIIFDAGSAKTPAVHALDFGGGNNDAAALWHVAQLALQSRKKSKLLVMISDGLPTECTVQALRELVKKLTKKFGMCCAQIAVENIEEVCFPHYVLVKEVDELTAVKNLARPLRTSSVAPSPKQRLRS